MMKHIRKTLPSMVLFAVLCFVVGFGSKTVELLNQEPLIDLDQAIHNADLGKEGSATPSEGKKEEVLQENTEAQKKEEDVKVTENVKAICQVIVRGEKILFEGQVCKDTEELKELIREKCSEKSVISVTDDYAEAHVYKDTLKAIKEVGINYTEEK